MNETLLLARRSIREVWRLPAATIPALAIPIFFFVVNLGQVTRTFPKQTPFLHGQSYAAFGLPVSMVFAVTTVTSGVAMVTDIDVGYIDKLRAAPIRRTAIIWGRLAADVVRGFMISILVLLVGVAFGARVASGAAGVILLLVLSTAWGVAYAGIGIWVALTTKNVQTTQASFLIFFPLLFLTPNFVPFDRLAPVMRDVAHINPVSYIITGERGLMLDDTIDWGAMGVAVGIIIAFGVLVTWASIRALNRFAR